MGSGRHHSLARERRGWIIEALVWGRVAGSLSRTRIPMRLSRPKAAKNPALDTASILADPGCMSDELKQGTTLTPMASGQRSAVALAGLSPEPEIPFKRGAIALLDALGFKGIWRRHGVTPRQVISKLSRLQWAAQEWLERSGVEVNPKLLAEGLAPPHNVVRFVSDSVYIAAWPTTPIPESLGIEHEIDPDRLGMLMCLATVTLIAQGLMLAALSDEPALIYRGVVTVGDFEIHERESFVVGPAVDEVASLEREADAALVWMTPAARATFDMYHATKWGHVVMHDVPMKGGRTYRTLVLNPLHPLSDDPRGGELLGRLLAEPPLSAPLDVHIKQQNTLNFYRRVMPELTEKVCPAPSPSEPE